MKRTLEVINVKCGGCAGTLTSKLEEQFGAVEVDLSVEPRKITVDIEDAQMDDLAAALKQLGYPLVTEEMGFVDGATAKAKSFVSCAVGKMNA